MQTEKKKLLGKGGFTTAYLLGNGTVEIISNDPIKECMSLGWFPRGRLFPKIKQIFDHDPDSIYKIYHMEFYDRPRSLKSNLCPHDWELYKELRKLYIPCHTEDYMKCDKWHGAFDTISDKFSAEKEEIKEALDACSNYGTDIGFEISPRNVALRDDNLILLDVFYMHRKCREMRKSKLDRQRKLI